MKNPNTKASKLKTYFRERWFESEVPGSAPIFQIKKALKDVTTTSLVALLPLILFKSCESGASHNISRRTAKRSDERKESRNADAGKSQIIDFSGRGFNPGRFARVSSAGAAAPGIANLPKKAPGSLVKVRLLNVVETYATAPVHAQIIDLGLGRTLMGGTLIGDANPDGNFDRINIGFRFARDPNRDGVAIPLTARALSLDGTLGLEANKKEGFFARSMMGSAVNATQNGQISGGQETGLRSFLLQALTSGLIQEMGSSSQIERNRSQVLSLKPGSEFFAELTDFFPGGR